MGYSQKPCIYVRFECEGEKDPIKRAAAMQKMSVNEWAKKVLLKEADRSNRAEVQQAIWRSRQETNLDSQ